MSLIMVAADLEPELVADVACHTAECPLWHPVERVLYWTDIPAGRLYRIGEDAAQPDLVYEGDVIGGMTLQANGALLFLGEGGSVRVFASGSVSTLIERLPGEEDFRFNDAVADPAGRVYSGTISKEGRRGRLYRIRRDGECTILKADVRFSNGMGFTHDRTVFYHIDTERRTLSRFGYHLDTGDVGEGNVLIDFADEEGKPDGMTVDAAGNLWVALYGGGVVLQYSPDGEEMRRVRFPVLQVSSVCFGGSDYGSLYVTTAGGQDRERNGPLAGSVFRVKVAPGGVPEFPSKIGLYHG